jgi:hypothetical protein
MFSTKKIKKEQYRGQQKLHILRLSTFSPHLRLFHLKKQEDSIRSASENCSHGLSPAKKRLIANQSKMTICIFGHKKISNHITSTYINKLNPERISYILTVLLI